MRFGIKMPMVTGLLLMAVGSSSFAQAPVDGNFAADVLPSMPLQGFGAGIAFNPLLLAAMSDVAPRESGLASEVVNTAFMMGGALGLAILASLAASAPTACSPQATASSPLLRFLVGADLAVVTAAVGAVLLRAGLPAPAHEGEIGVPAAAEAD